MDPESYAAQMTAYEEAGAETVSTAKSLINGYYWSFYVNSMSYQLEFWADNNFEVRTGLGISNSGTCSVRNGYIFCQYPGDAEPAVKIPYEIADGKINLDTIGGFSVMG